MEGDEGNRNGNNTNCVVGQKVCTALGTGAVMVSEKSNMYPFDSSVDPDLEDFRIKEKQMSSPEPSYEENGAAMAESELQVQQENEKERKERETDVESQKNKEDQHASTSQHEPSGAIPSVGWESSHQTETAQGVSANSLPDNSTPQNQSLVCAGGESCLESLDEKISVSSDRQCSGGYGTPGTNLQGSGKTEDHLSAVGKVIPLGDELGKISMHQTSRQSKTDSAVHGSLDNMRCQMEENPEEMSSGSLTYSTCSSNIQQLDSSAGQKCAYREQPEMETSSFSDQTNSHEQPAENTEGKTETGYLDGVISSIQSLPYSHTEADKDTVKISRAELTLMEQQMLTAQTMSSYMQGLEQKNKMLNKQNEALKDTIVQTRNWREGKVETDPLKSMPVIGQGTGAQVFCFPGSLPAAHSQLPSSSRQAPSQQHNQTNSDHTKETDTGGLQNDGDWSSSLQLASQLYIDGDTVPRISGAALSPHVPSLNGAASGPSSQGSFHHNLPNASLLNEAHSYSTGPQQYEEGALGCAGVSPEQFKRVVDELEKTKRFVHNISSQAGIHPDGIQELVSLREKVQTVQEENSKLKMELTNRPDMPVQPDMKPVICQGREEHARPQDIIIDLRQKIQDQRNREDQLHKLIETLGAENKTLKSDAARPQSQPPSNVGLQALPPISHTATLPVASVERQTEGSYLAIQGYAAKVTHLQEALKQAQSSKAECEKAVQTLKYELQEKSSACSQLQMTTTAFHHKLQELNQHCKDLAQQRNGLELECKKQKKELDQEKERIRHLETVCREVERHGLESLKEAKRKHLQEVDRNGKLENMLQDERKRYARDEKELLERVKLLTGLTKEMELLQKLVLAVDQARLDGLPLSKDWADMVAALRVYGANKAATASAPSVRASRSCSNIAGPPSNPRFQQPQSFSGSSSAGQASAPPHQGNASQRGGPGNAGAKSPPHQGNASQRGGPGNAGAKSPPHQGNASQRGGPGNAGAKSPPHQGNASQRGGPGNTGAKSSGRGHHSSSNPPL